MLVNKGLLRLVGLCALSAAALLTLFRAPSLSAGQLSRPEATTTPGPLFLPLVIQTPHFVLQPGNPKYTQNFNELGCAYLGIAGQVFDLNDQHIIGLLVHIEGVDDPYDTITGSKPEFGPGGYELFLGFDPIDTTDVYSVQVRDLSGIPLSDAYFIPTFDDCAKNLILVNFVQDR